MNLGKIPLQGINLLLYSQNVYLGLLLEGVNITRYIEIVIILGYLLASGYIGVTFLNNPLFMFALFKTTVGRNYVVDILLAQTVLVLAVLILPARIDK